jgi:hypothetical protein
MAAQPPAGASRARKQRNEIGLKPLITHKTAKWPIRRPKSFQRLRAPNAKHFVSQGEMKLSRAGGLKGAPGEPQKRT